MRRPCWRGLQRSLQGMGRCRRPCGLHALPSMWGPMLVLPVPVVSVLLHRAVVHVHIQLLHPRRVVLLLRLAQGCGACFATV